MTSTGRGAMLLSWAKKVIGAQNQTRPDQKFCRVGGEDGRNKMMSSLCTMVLNFYPYMKTNIQYKMIFSHANCLWNTLPENDQF